MATILRVKRLNSDQPQDALILCKRPRLMDDGDDEAACSDLSPTYAKFAGTLKAPDENVLQHLAETLSKEETENNFKKPPCINFLEQRRKQTKENSAANRFKVVNYHRSLDTTNVEEFEDKVMTFIDVEDSISLAVNQNTVTTTQEEEEQGTVYMYDLYYAADHSYVDDHIAIHPYKEHELVYDVLLDDTVNSEHDSEDSNAESYYQNSYPSTEYSDENSITECDMKVANKVFNDYTSSEEEYENYIDEENEQYPLDMNDVAMHGYKYARYKQRMKPLLYGNANKDADDNTDSSNPSDSDEEIYPWNSNGHLVYDVSNNANNV